MKVLDLIVLLFSMKEKHFLDTSVLRPLLTSPKKVKNYYLQKLKGEKYICDYIKMEFLRGYIKSLIDFYFLLSIPHYNISEVLHVWSQKFQIRDHKNIVVMISNLLEFRGCIDNKEKSLRAIADYIRRLIGKLNENFKSIGNDNTYCKKGKTKLNFLPHSINESFRSFFDTIKDNEQYKMCKINDFIYEKHKNDIQKLIENAEKVKNSGNREGFDKIIRSLNKLSSKKITCSGCSKLGDAVISILVDNDMILEHTDYSFTYLCTILNKRHNLHPNDKLIMDNSV